MCLSVCACVRCFGLSVFAWLHHRIGFSNLFLYYISLSLCRCFLRFSSWQIWVCIGSCRLDGITTKEVSTASAHMALIHKLGYNYGEQVHKIISTCSFVALNKIFLWAFPIHRIAFSACHKVQYSTVQHSTNTKMFITYLACVRAQHRVHCRCVCPWYLFRLHICLSVLSIYANPAGDIQHFGWFKHANLCAIDGFANDMHGIFRWMSIPNIIWILIETTRLNVFTSIWMMWMRWMNAQPHSHPRVHVLGYTKCQN